MGPKFCSVELSKPEKVRGVSMGTMEGALPNGFALDAPAITCAACASAILSGVRASEGRDLS